MTKARDLANIITGGFTADDIPNIPASKITSGQFADARIADLNASKLTGSIADARVPASAVSQHATSFDDNKIVNDISTLAIRQASNENKSAYNTNSMYVDVFQDGTGIGSNTNAPRDTNEFVSAITSTQTSIPVKFLINQNGSNNSTTMTDATGNHSITRNGNTKWDTAQYKFGSSSIYFDGNDDYLQMSDSSDWNFDNDNNGYTSEMWYKQLGTTGEDGYGNAALFGQHSGSGNGNPRRFVWRNSASGVKHYASTDTPDGAGEVSNVANLEDGNWHHIALVYEHNSGNGKLGVAVDGTWGTPSTSGVSTAYSPGNASGSYYIGVGQASNGATGYLHGYMDGFRITHKNMYTIGTNFTAPTTAFAATETTLAVSATGNFISNAITAPSSVSKMGAIITYQNQAGTNNLNSDIVLQLSADNGSNFTTATLTAMPDFTTGIKMAKVNDLSVTAGTQLKYKISFANQSSGSKEARIRGVSLQY
ncbi:putative lectin [uncultured Mediterranean phage uvMED]|nr:MAG: hypothetical protein CBD88_05965 [Flavobacteriales bacterium TMED228]BAQ87735.1 putative lectin [uncultured Mediterranean phage uvMED]BAQ87758.1 putative lectin [uncultured Mediterranean phage uvMED]